MTLINVLVFVVLKTKNSFSCKNPCLQIIADVSKISKIIQGNMVFILNVLF